MSQLGARQYALARLSPMTLARISVACAVIAAVWLTVATVRADLIALVAAVAIVFTGHGGRVAAGERASAAVEWGLVGCGMLTEVAVYTGIAVAGAFHSGSRLSGSHLGLAGGALSGTFVSGLGGAGAAGVWRLAIMAVMLTTVTAIMDVCVHGPALLGTRLWLFGPPGDVRLPAACAAFLAFGDRSAFLVVIVLGVAAFGATVIDGTSREAERGELRGYRGDGRIAMWLGKWVAGRVPPFPLLFVGLLVTGVLSALGLHNLSGILLLTPVEAMLIAAFASWHPHDGPGDWLVPPLLQGAEYVFLAEIGYAGHVWPPLTFAVVALAGLRHLDLAYRVRGDLADGIDRPGLGWDGRMIFTGIAAAIGIAPVAYALLAPYLGWRVGKDWMIGWSARHPAVNR